MNGLYFSLLATVALPVFQTEAMTISDVRFELGFRSATLDWGSSAIMGDDSFAFGGPIPAEAGGGGY